MSNLENGATQAPDNFVTYAAAHLVNYQLTGFREGFGSTAAEIAERRYLESFAALGSAAQKGAAAFEASETEAGMPTFQMIGEVHKETWARLTSYQKNY